jgi:hypothetical protein
VGLARRDVHQLLMFMLAHGNVPIR